MPDNKASCSEIVLLYELAAGRAPANTGLTVRNKLFELGLDDVLHPNSLVRDAARQQTAAVWRSCSR